MQVCLGDDFGNHNSVAKAKTYNYDAKKSFSYSKLITIQKICSV